MAKLMQTVRLTQIDPKGHYLITVYTQSLDVAALRVADTQGSQALSAYRSILQLCRGQHYGHYHGRRVDFCEGGERLVCVWFIWEDCKDECCIVTRKYSATATQEG